MWEWVFKRWLKFKIVVLWETYNLFPRWQLFFNTEFQLKPYYWNHGRDTDLWVQKGRLVVFHTALSSGIWGDTWPLTCCASWKTCFVWNIQRIDFDIFRILRSVSTFKGILSLYLNFLYKAQFEVIGVRMGWKNLSKNSWFFNKGHMLKCNIVYSPTVPSMSTLCRIKRTMGPLWLNAVEKLTSSGLQYARVNSIP